MEHEQHTRTGALRVAGFMSGSGTNLRRIIELQKNLGETTFKVAAIFTDTKDEKKCNARKIGEEYRIPVIIRDIKDYYLARGMASRRDMKIREEYDTETARELRQYEVGLVALCGYMSVVTAPIYENFITLNVHPADLTKTRRGKRVYAGCAGAECVKKAVLNREREIRATVHIVNGELDGGPIISVSRPVDLSGFNRGRMEEDAEKYLNQLKENGDWMIYPDTIRLIAEGRLKIMGNSEVYLDGVLMKNGYRP